MEKRKKTCRWARCACLAFLCGGLAWACAKEELEAAGGAEAGGGLAAYREQVVTKAAQPDSWFEEGTKYRIWVMDAGLTPDMGDAENGYDGTERVREDGVRYIDFRPVEGSAARDFYGFTSASTAERFAIAPLTRRVLAPERTSLRPERSSSRSTKMP